MTFLSSAAQSAGLLRRSSTRQHLENTLNASTLMPQHWSPFSFLHPIHLTHTAAPNIEHQAEISKTPAHYFR